MQNFCGDLFIHHNKYVDDFRKSLRGRGQIALLDLVLSLAKLFNTFHILVKFQLGLKNFGKTHKTMIGPETDKAVAKVSMILEKLPCLAICLNCGLVYLAS